MESELLLPHFQYELPDDRIARFPLAQRDQSQLLVYRQGTIEHRRFRELPDYLPADSLLVFNDTKVIPARLHFQKATGAVIELFLLNPAPVQAEPRLVNEAMSDPRSSVWQCMVGNRKRWKADEVLTQSLTVDGQRVVLRASWQDPAQSSIRFDWATDDSFAAVLHEAGRIPLPPYLKREVTDADRDTYQTIYSRLEGAVAAPTAGLHFTPAVFEQLAQVGVQTDYLTLHVGAGTFQPIKEQDVRQHVMHTEQVVYTRANLEKLLSHSGPVIPVGTTSMRSLESLYWFGVRLLKNEPAPFHLDQHYAYGLAETDLPSKAEALAAVRTYLQEAGLDQLVAHTGIYITPGYRLRVCNGLITNFHQPGSTLILLVAALIGDNWRTVYREALDHSYRFLSYGDSSLLLP